MVNQFYDVLIIGSGGAGLAAAIMAAKHGKKIAIISKVDPLKSHTIAAQGGINAALGNISKDDPKWHIYDTIKASDWLADQDSVETMCNGARDMITMLDEIGVEFDRNQDGRIDQKIYGGQSTNFGKGPFAHRACYSKDKTGHTIMHCLYDEAKKYDIDFYNYHFALDLVTSDRACLGVVCLDIETGEVKTILAHNTIIASGGYSQIYSTATSAAICTGDGNGLIARAGLPLQDMEFIQFHPTAIHHIGVLITEAARSAGGKLLNGKGERFMERYAPNFMELAARDVVARSIAREIIEGRGAGKERDHVLLDLTHLTRQQIQETLPTVFENCQSFLNLDPSETPIPISPAAHYTMGGIPTDAKCQVISSIEDKAVTGLFAIGEAACISVHGANRLGCNSLLDLLVFAKVAVDNLKNDSLELSIDSAKITELALIRIQKILTEANNKSGSESIDQLTKEMKEVINKHAGVFRDKNSLEQGLTKLTELKKKFQNYRVPEQKLAWNLDLIKYIELANMITSAEATIISALWRQESRGAHYRNDFPNKDDKFLVHSLIWMDNLLVKPRMVRKTSINVDFFQDTNRNY